MFTCPVCFYDELVEPPINYNICECCGTEFGNDDDMYSPDELRTNWMTDGAKWFFGNPPVAWNPWRQLFEANVGDLPYYTVSTFGGGSVSVKTRVTAGVAHHIEENSFALAS